MQLMGEAIERSGAEAVQCPIHTQAAEWFETLPRDIISDIRQQVLEAAYPLHPVATLVLPMLCTRYAQNDRSLFTFLTRAEPYSFKKFLEETTVETIEGDPLPTLKPDRVYDYFIEAVGMGLASRPNLSRWVEVQLRCSSNNSNGLAGYWLDDQLPPDVPPTTADGKPLIVLSAVGIRAPVCYTPDA